MFRRMACRYRRHRAVADAKCYAMLNLSDTHPLRAVIFKSPSDDEEVLPDL
jgi:hypothetical protein